MSRRANAPIAVAAALVITFLPGQLARAADVLASLTVEAGNQARIDTPVSVSLEGISISEGRCRLVEIVGNRRVAVPSQIEPGRPSRLHWILAGNTPADGRRVYELESGEAAAGAVMQARQGETGLEIYSGDTHVLQFQTAVMPPPTGASQRYARSGFIHPLRTPSGAVLTRIHPKDHIHHMGLWNPWTSTEFEGRHVDFWNVNDGTGTVRFAKLLAQISGPVFGGFQAAQEHVALNTSSGAKVALNEVLDVRVWNVGGAEKGYWLVDFTSTQRCASASPLKLLKYRYGGIGFRGTEQWNEKNSDYLTSEGKTRKDGHGTRARWCNIFGQTASGPAGVEFMSHPQNHQHPEPMRIWPEGDVFFNFCPIQAAEWIMEPGQEYVLRYRLYVYDGKATPEICERLWQDFGNPPVVKLQKK